MRWDGGFVAMLLALTLATCLLMCFWAAVLLADRLVFLIGG